MKRKLTLALITLALCAASALASSWQGWSDTTARTVSASSTQYTYLLGPGAAFSSTESARTQTAPAEGYISDFYITTISAQPSTGSLICSVRVNGADTDVDGDGMTVTIAANAAAGTFRGVDTKSTSAGGSVRVKERQTVALKCVNNASGTSAGIS
jgi:hypothetical protein